MAATIYKNQAPYENNEGKRRRSLSVQGIYPISGAVSVRSGGPRPPSERGAEDCGILTARGPCKSDASSSSPGNNEMRSSGRVVGGAIGPAKFCRHAKTLLLARRAGNDLAAFAFFIETFFHAVTKPSPMTRRIDPLFSDGATANGVIAATSAELIPSMHGVDPIDASCVFLCSQGKTASAPWPLIKTSGLNGR
jgi:hypothetical protein